MPTYEYLCKSCGHLFEIVQSMRDEPLTECPECGGVLRKVFAPPAIAFKGSGFYATDQRKSSGAGEGANGGKEPKKADAAASKEGSKKATGKQSEGTPGSGGSSSTTSSSKDSPSPSSPSPSSKEGSSS